MFVWPSTSACTLPWTLKEKKIRVFAQFPPRLFFFLLFCILSYVLAWTNSSVPRLAYMYSTLFRGHLHVISEWVSEWVMDGYERKKRGMEGRGRGKWANQAFYSWVGKRSPVLRLRIKVQQKSCTTLFFFVQSLRIAVIEYLPSKIYRLLWSMCCFPLCLCVSYVKSVQRKLLL